MNWRVAIAIFILATWFWFLLQARHDPGAKDLFDQLNGLALAAVTFIFTEPVLRDRREKRRRRRKEDDERDE